MGTNYEVASLYPRAPAQSPVRPDRNNSGQPEPPKKNPLEGGGVCDCQSVSVCVILKSQRFCIILTKDLVRASKQVGNGQLGYILQNNIPFYKLKENKDQNICSVAIF